MTASETEEEDYGVVNHAATERDTLLLKCRDAIESLHQELEEERNEKRNLEN